MAGLRETLVLELKRLRVVCNRGRFLQCNVSDISLNLGNAHERKIVNVLTFVMAYQWHG